MIKKIVLIFLISTFSLFAKEFQIKGVVLDENSLALPSAIVELRSKADSTIIGGDKTDAKGKFIINANKNNYYLRISYLSYKDKYIDLDTLNSSVDLGILQLVPENINFSEVIVEAEKSTTELAMDKRIFNVGKDLTNAGGSAADLLDNVPSVNVDVEGNINLRGSNNVRILINGKPSGIVSAGDAEGLRNLMGNMVERIEVITNPSAKYEAEGDAGIINIILKTERQKGWNGSFVGTLGNPDNFGISGNSNYRRDDINFFGSYALNYNENPGYGFQYQQFSETDSIFAYQQDRDHVRGGFSNNFRIGFDYYFTQNDILTSSVLYSFADGKNTADLVYSDFDINNELIRRVDRTDDEEEIAHDFETSLNYRKIFEKKDQELTIDFKYILNDDTEIASQLERNNLDNSVIEQRSDNEEDEINFIFQSDYVHPFNNKSKLETGLRSGYRFINNNFLVEERIEENLWQAIPRFDDNFLFTELIHAAYVSYDQKFGKFGFMAGLRSEYTDLQTELKAENTINNQDYLDFFPNLNISYEITNLNSLQLSYSRRISRPRFRLLLPFWSFSDSRNFFGGNPNLQPEYTDSYEITNLFNWEGGSFLSSLYYRHTKGEIERVVITDENGFTRIFPINLSIEDSYGLEFTGDIELTNWLQINGDINFLQIIKDGEYEGESLYVETLTWRARLNAKFKFFKYFNLQTSFRYRAPEDTPQGNRREIYTVDFGLSYDFLGGDATITLSGRDLFNTRVRETETFGDGFETFSEFQWRSRQLLMNFNYRLNTKKKSDDIIDDKGELN